MKKRQWLLTTVLCGGLLAVGTVRDVAAQSAGRILQPNSDWAVSQLSAANMGGQPYCALARRFSNDLILTMARNAQDESSVAVDFQRMALNNAQTYRVTLDPGFGQQRAFNIKPVSGKALVVRLGQDYAFHDALGRSGQLKLDISGEGYTFSIADFSQGQQKLGACLVNLVEPAAGGRPAAQELSPIPTQPSPQMPQTASVTPAPRSPAQAAVTPVNTSQGASQPLAMQGGMVSPAASGASSTAELAGDIQALREENMRLRNALERERRNYEDVYMREGQRSSVVAELNEKMRLLELENGQLRGQLGHQAASPAPLSCPPPQDNSGALRALENEVSLLQAENMRLKEAGSATAGAIDTALSREIEMLRAENQQVRQELAAQRAFQADIESQLAAQTSAGSRETAVIAGLRDRIRDLEIENKSLRNTQAQNASAGGGVSLAQLRSLEEQLRLVEQDRDRLMAQIDLVSDQKEKGLLDISSDNWDLEQAARRYNEAEREIRRLSRELEEQRTRCAMERKELEYMLFDPAVAEQQQISKLLSLEEQVRSSDAVLAAQKEGYEAQLVELRDRFEALETEKVAMAAQRADYAQKLAALEQTMLDNDSASSGAQVKIAALEHELETTRIAAKAARERTGAIAPLQQELDRLAQQKFAIEQQKLAMTQENQTLKTQMAALQTQLAAIETASGQERDAGLAQLVEQNKTLMHERELIERDKNDLALRQADLERQIASLQTALAEAQTASEAGQAEREAALAQLTEQNKALVQEREQIERDKNDLAARQAELETQVASLQTALAEAQTASEAGQAAEQSRQEHIAALREKNSVLAEERTRLENEQRALEARETALTAQVESLEEALEEQRAVFEQRIADLQEQGTSSAATIAALKKQEAVFTGKIASLETALSPINTAAGSETPPKPALETPPRATPEAERDERPAVSSHESTRISRKIDVTEPLVEDGHTERAEAAVEGVPSEIRSYIEDEPQKALYDPARPDAASPRTVQKTVQAQRNVARPPVAALETAPLMRLDDMARLLTRAQISFGGALQKVSADNDPGVAYGWESAGVFGSAEQEIMDGPGQFEEKARRYISKTEARCQGDFASVPVMTERTGDIQVSSYEIACVSGQGGAAASLVFYSDGQTFTAIAHESDMAMMDIAMDIRDRLARSLLDTRIALR